MDAFNHLPDSKSGCQVTGCEQAAVNGFCYDRIPLVCDTHYHVKPDGQTGTTGYIQVAASPALTAIRATKK